MCDGTGPGIDPCEPLVRPGDLTDEALELARAALAKTLTNNQTLKSDRNFHLCFVSGYLSALSAAEHGETALPPEDTTYDGYRTGYRTAMLDLGIADEIFADHDGLEMATCDVCGNKQPCIVTRGATNDPAAPIAGAVCLHCNGSSHC